MFKLGDTILYGPEGVCRISEITTKTFGGTDIEYYVLTPVFSANSTFFVPTQNSKLTSRMHPVLSGSEMMSVIETSKELNEWPQDDSERKKVFKDIISAGNIGEIVSVFKSVLNHKKEVEEAGKKLHKSDESVLKEAQKIIYESIALDMELTKEDVADIVLRKK
ncbi:MAG: hypothetical protein E7395_03545 [Ruminococcaceae bacterium]|nr:hypothetical protein [Oscillospiraceae bacterium]